MRKVSERNTLILEKALETLKAFPCYTHNDASDTKNVIFYDRQQQKHFTLLH